LISLFFPSMSPACRLFRACLFFNPILANFFPHVRFSFPSLQPPGRDFFLLIPGDRARLVILCLSSSRRFVFFFGAVLRALFVEKMPSGPCPSLNSFRCATPPHCSPYTARPPRPSRSLPRLEEDDLFGSDNRPNPTSCLCSAKTLSFVRHSLIESVRDAVQGPRCPRWLSSPLGWFIYIPF